MDQLFQELLDLFTKAGGSWVVPIIAVVGIIILGILKYCATFAKIEEQYRHYIYIGISMGISLLGTGIYLAVTKTFTINLFFALATIIWTINQTAYNLFSVLSLKELFIKLLDWIKNLISKNKKQ